MDGSWENHKKNTRKRWFLGIKTINIAGPATSILSASKIFGLARKRRVSEEKCSCRSTKRLICLKQKDWSKKWVLVTSNRCPDHLSRQFLITDSTYPYSSKNSSVEHIHTLPTCLTLKNSLTHIDKHTHSHTLTHSLSLSLSHTHTHTHTHTHAHAHASARTQRHV